MEAQRIRVIIVAISSNQIKHTLSSSRIHYTLSSSRINHTLSSNQISHTLSSNLVKHTFNQREPIKVQVLLISLFPHFRIQGPMLGLPVIQPLITILVIIRHPVATQLQVTIVRRTRGIKEAMQVMLINIQTTLQNPMVLIMLKVPLHHLYNINKIINNGQIIIVKQKSLVLLVQKM